MKSLFNNQHGVTAFADNVAFTAASGGPMWKSGLKVVPNTTNTSAIVVNVEPGTVEINGSEVSIPNQTVELSPVPSNNDPAITNARIDVIHATTNGIGVTEGVDAPKRPTKASPYNDDVEGTFPSIWSPAPNDGGQVPGVGRAIVYVDENTADSTDISQTEIVNYDADGTAQGITQETLRESIESINLTSPSDAIQTTVKNSRHLGGMYHNQWRRNFFTINVPGSRKKVPTSGFDEKYLTLPPNHTFRVWRTSLSADGGGIESDISLEIVENRPNGSSIQLYETSKPADYQQNNTSAIAVLFGDNVTRQMTFRIINSGSSKSNDLYTAAARVSMRDTTINP